MKRNVVRMEINPEIKDFLAPWTALLWMKTEYNFSLAGTMTKLRRGRYPDVECKLSREENF